MLSIPTQQMLLSLSAQPRELVRFHGLPRPTGRILSQQKLTQASTLDTFFADFK